MDAVHRPRLGNPHIRPPSTTKSWPLTKLPSSEARKTAALATSSANPDRGSGVACARVRSKVSLTRSLAGLACCSSAKREPALKQKISANAALRDIIRRRFLTSDAGTRKPREARRTIACLKSESRLITHRDAVEHVPRRGCGSVSLGASIKTANRLRPENLRGHRRCKAPFSFRTRRRRQSWRTLDGNASRLRLLINLQ